MTGRALTLAELDERRLELVDIKAQLRAIGRRKSVVETEILTGRVAPVKGAPAEQLPLVETATATTPATTAPEAPAQALEAAKPATATATARTAVQQREAVLAALRAAKGRRSGKVLATLLGESEEDIHECLMELIQRGEARSARRGGYEATDKPEPQGRNAKPGKVATKATSKGRIVMPPPRKPAALWKPGYKAGILPSLTAEGNRRALELISAAPGKKMLASEVRKALDLPDDCCQPNGCYYQGSLVGGDWWGIRDDGAAKPTKPAGKASAKKGKVAAKGKKSKPPSKAPPEADPQPKTPARDEKKAEPPAPPPAAPRADRQGLLRKAILDELGHGLATFGELLTTCMRDLAWTSERMPQTTEVRDVLRALCEEGKAVYDEAKKVYQLPPPPPPAPKKAPEAPRPTVTVGEALKKMLAEVSSADWQQARAEVCEKIAQRKGEPVSVGPLLLKVGCDSNLIGPVLELLDAAGAIVLGSRSGVRAPWGKAAPFATPTGTVGDKEIARDLQALTRRYVRELVEDCREPPTAADLAESLELPAALIDSVLIELRAAEELLCDREGRWSVRSPKASAAARTAPLFDDVEPAPAVDGLEPEGDES